MRLFGIVVGIVLLSFGAVRAEASVLYATGFENPPFVLGPINGQAGWFVFSASGQTSDPVIENTLVKTGSQAISVDGSVTGQTGPVYAPNFVNSVLDMSADLYLSSSSSLSEWQFASTGAGGVGFAGGIDIGSATSVKGGGTTIYAITGNFTTVIGTFTRDTWHHVDIILDYGTQTFGVELDGALLASNLHFCGNNPNAVTTFCNGAAVTSMGSDIFDSFGNGNDVGAMDNFAIATLVPEPATITLLVAGLIGFGALRRAPACSRFQRS